MSEINNERNSAPTGVNVEVNEMNLEAKDPLGGAACSASSGNGQKVMIEVYDPELGKSQSVMYDFVKDRGKLKEGSMVMAFVCITTTEITKHRELFDELLEKYPVDESVLALKS